MKPYQSSFRLTPPAWEAAQDLFGWAAKDVWVIEASPEQEEEQVERERQDDQESAGGVSDGHRLASGSGSWSNLARRSQVRRPKTSAPLAPKLVNWS
jgi:hypothetical protein